MIQIPDFIEHATVCKTRFDHLKFALEQTTSDGLYCEFGVWRAESANFIARHITPTKLWAFDSGEGLPEEWRVNRELSYPKGYLNQFGAALEPNVLFVKGWFKDSLPRWKEELAPQIEPDKENVSFIHIDSDLYSSAITVLTELDSRIVPGTVIVFDELYGWEGDYEYYEEGEWKALQEWGREVKALGRRTEGRQASVVVI